MKKVVVLLFISLIFISGCTEKSEENKVFYKSITSEEAHAMMSENSDLIILDVRSKDEYNTGHIENAINIPVNEIGDRFKEEITSDKLATILVYCKSGVRAKQASELLVDLGYSNIYEFGGLNNWKYELVTN